MTKGFIVAAHPPLQSSRLNLRVFSPFAAANALVRHGRYAAKQCLEVRYSGPTYVPEECHFCWRSGLPSNTKFIWVHTSLPLQTASRSVRPFLHTSAVFPTDRHTQTCAATAVFTPRVETMWPQNRVLICSLVRNYLIIGSLNRSSSVARVSFVFTDDTHAASTYL